MEVIEAVPIPDDIRQTLPKTDFTMSDVDVELVWLGAGIATQIGVILIDNPSQFVTDTEGATPALLTPVE